jgi:hypothetical protein
MAASSAECLSIGIDGMVHLVLFSNSHKAQAWLREATQAKLLK